MKFIRIISCVKNSMKRSCLHRIISANGLKAQTSSKKADGTTATSTTKENAIKKTFGKFFMRPLDFDSF